MPNCFVKGCKNTSKNGTRLFVFPRDEKRRQIWSTKCGRNATPHSRICEFHFEESQFECYRLGEWRKLKANAIPTIFNKNDLTRSDSDINPNTTTDKDILLQDTTRDNRYENIRGSIKPRYDKTDNLRECSVLIKQKKMKTEYEATTSDTMNHEDDEELKERNNMNVNTMMMSYDNDGNELMNMTTWRWNQYKKQWDFKNMCRTCCSCDRRTELYSLFTASSSSSNNISNSNITIDLQIGTVYADMLIEIADLKIMQGDPLPQKICTFCVDKLNTAYYFIKQCQNVKFKFEQYLNQQQQQQHESNGEGETTTMGTWTERGAHGHDDDDDVSEIKQESLNILNINHQDDDFDPDWNDDQIKNNEISELEQEIDLDDDDDDDDDDEHKKSTKKKKKKQRLKMHECPTCLKKTHHLKDHMRTHTKPYKCDQCGMKFSRRSNCARHKKIHLNEALKKKMNDNNDEEGKPTKKKYKRRFHECPICTRKTQHLKVHMRSHTKEKPYKCEVCGRQFASRSNYSRHVKIHLNERPHVCEICKRAFTIRHSLVSHMKTHSTETSYKCELCDNAFKHLSQLKQHTSEAHQDNEQIKDILASIDPQRNFLCDLCGKSYLRRYEFEGHLRAHTGEKPFSCTICGKTFSTSPLLYLHRKTHSIEKPHKCTYCDKHFRTRQLCKRHELIHTGEKPLKCDLCGKCFRKSSHLTRHKRTHTGEKPYGCNICNKHFIVRDRLNAHIRIQHTGETPYTCQVCNEKFADLKIMRRHEKKLHSNNIQQQQQHSLTTTSTPTSTRCQQMPSSIAPTETSSIAGGVTVTTYNDAAVVDIPTPTVTITTADDGNNRIIIAQHQQVEQIESTHSQFLFC